jgi:hypothetical protein
LIFDCGSNERRAQGDLLLKVGNIVLNLGSHPDLGSTRDLKGDVIWAGIERTTTIEVWMPYVQLAAVEDWLTLAEHEGAACWHLIALLAASYI